MAEHLTPAAAPGRATLAARAAAACIALGAAVAATLLVADVAFENGVQVWDVIRAGLIFLTTAWLGWGAGLAAVGLWPRRFAAAPSMPAGSIPPTIVLMPVCNEDPRETFARVAAMARSFAAEGLSCDMAILSDTRDPATAEAERVMFAGLRREAPDGAGLYYRRRRDNYGRKAGNIEEFMRRSGGAYDYAVILDADSLMDGAAVGTLIARMQADPNLGLLQTLPRLVGARSVFGRAMQFAAGFHGRVFTRGAARMQGRTGPYWGHNAIVRIAAFAQSCGLPELGGRPPFGGHILSHDYVEAALLARNGWRVEVDERIPGSYEEGPENVLAHARRDRRWCQGNLQHARLLAAPGLAGWSRWTFLQGIFSYLISVFWAAFLLATLLGTASAPPPDYFPERHMLFPVFPSDRTREIAAVALGIVGLLILPKVSVLAGALRSGRARDYGGRWRAALSVPAEILLTSVLAPVMLMFQCRAVLEVLAGQDGGWPANARGEGRLTLAEAARASLWIVAWGALILFVTIEAAPGLALWVLPVALPMIAAPALIAWSSRPARPMSFAMPEDAQVPEVVQSYREIAARWGAAPDPGMASDAAAAADRTGDAARATV